MKPVLIIIMLFLSLNSSAMLTGSKFINHSPSELKKNQAAIAKINEVVKSDCFKTELLKRNLIQTNGKTNQQVFETILASNIDIELSMYRKRFSKVNGYTYPSSKVINLNRKYHDYYGVCSVANNLAHEWTHKIGFGHDYNPNKLRPFSVPYSLNSIFLTCCKDSL